MAVAAKSPKLKRDAEHNFRAMLIELPVYAVLVVAYFFAVLHLLSDWLGHLKENHNTLYALVSIGLIIGQAVVLESVTSLLLRLIRRRTD